MTRIERQSEAAIVVNCQPTMVIPMDPIAPSPEHAMVMALLNAVTSLPRDRVQAVLDDSIAVRAQYGPRPELELTIRVLHMFLEAIGEREATDAQTR